MYALIMAGGAGSRLNLGEKPLISICGYPMISYIIDAFDKAGCTPVVLASSKTPMTINWCRAQGIDFCKTEGSGYVHDMVEGVKILGENNPLFVSVSDIPCITPEIIHTISHAYQYSGKDACSTWVPETLVNTSPDGMPYREMVQGISACPAGVNILRGSHIDQTQDELQLLLKEPRLAMNVNTKADRVNAEIFLKQNPVLPYKKNSQ